MKRIYIIIGVMLLIGLSAVAKKNKQLVILHSNDTHSCILPHSENLADTLIAGRGGFLRRITMLKEERKKNPDLIYLDAGDFCQGSAYFSLFKGDVEVKLMNMMGIDASTLGNHEWDNGIEQLIKIIKAANFPIVCSNYDFTGTELDGLLKKYIIIQRGGMKIGVFAVCPKLKGLVDVKNFGNVKYNDPAECALEMATKLKKEEKCDAVICISHLGWKTGDEQMIKGSRYIDLVLGGHSHTYFEQLEYVEDLDGQKVPVNQNGKHGVFIGKLTVNLEK